jgi:hypothetical protein
MAPDLLPGTLDLLDNRRGARYYTLTTAGRRQLASEHAEFQQIVAAIQRVLNTT